MRGRDGNRESRVGRGKELDMNTSGEDMAQHAGSVQLGQCSAQTNKQTHLPPSPLRTTRLPETFMLKMPQFWLEQSSGAGGQTGKGPGLMEMPNSLL